MKKKYNKNGNSLLSSPGNKEIMAWLEDITTSKTKTGIWVEYEGRDQFYKYEDTFGYNFGIRKITKNLATGGWYDKVPTGWQVVDVWKDIDDNETFIDPVKKKIKEVLFLLSKGQKVCVRCACGMNRSNSIATAVLVYLDKNGGSIKTKWLRYKRLVESKVDRAWMNPDLGYTCRLAIRELKDVENIQLNQELIQTGENFISNDVVRRLGGNYNEK